MLRTSLPAPLLAPLLALAALACLAPSARAQGLVAADPVLARIREEATERSTLYPLAQALLDSIGPRLTGTPLQRAANEWAVATYRGWGIDAWNEPYGTWTEWRRGTTHVDLLEPRVRTLEAAMLAWSPGTEGPVSGAVVAIPRVATPAEFRAWLPRVRGRFVLVSFPQPTCRPDESWKTWATPESLERMTESRAAARAEWTERLRATGVDARDLARVLEEAGAAGILTSYWAGGWGVEKFHARASTRRAPSLEVSCEDYGLLARLAENGQGPVIRVDARAEFGGEVPVFNTVAAIRGTERPDEYVILSAHFDSWDAASGATDNGSGTVVMMEAMRILKAVYPTPRRTILVGHWGGEEQGINGSRAFAADHPEVVAGVQVVLNQDTGTGRVTSLSMQGFTRIAPIFERWLGRVPDGIGARVEVEAPGAPSPGSSDHAAFVCGGVPALMLNSLSWDYGTYTWHTNRDTFDKLVLDDMRDNAILVASLAYQAAEEPALLPRERRTDLPANPRSGAPGRWPACQPAVRTGAAIR